MSDSETFPTKSFTSGQAPVVSQVKESTDAPTNMVHARIDPSNPPLKKRKHEKVQPLFKECLQKSMASSPSLPLPSLLKFPKAGLKLSYILNGFIDDYCRRGGGGEDDILRMTTREVRERVIKPCTERRQSSFVDVLKSNNHPAYGAKANVFVSHAHQSQFWNTIQAVQRCVSKDTTNDYGDVVVWIDLFSINQHQPNVWTTDWLFDTFQDAIKEIGRTIMVTSPWNHPIRSWCIFEVYSTLHTGSKFDIAIGEDDEKQFLNDILTAKDDNDAMSVMNRLFSTIRAENSQCTSDEDQSRIFQVIRDKVRFEEIDKMVLDACVKRLITVVKEFLHKTAGQEGTDVERKRARLESIVRRLQHQRH